MKISFEFHNGESLVKLCAESERDRDCIKICLASDDTAHLTSSTDGMTILLTGRKLEG